MVNCSSCSKNIANHRGSTEFDCPQCGKQKIVRCGHCKQITTRYKCTECGFEGPN